MQRHGIQLPYYDICELYSAIDSPAAFHPVEKKANAVYGQCQLGKDIRRQIH